MEHRRRALNVRLQLSDVECHNGKLRLLRKEGGVLRVLFARLFFAVALVFKVGRNLRNGALRERLAPQADEEAAPRVRRLGGAAGAAAGAAASSTRT